MKDQNFYIDLIINDKIKREKAIREYEPGRQLHLELPLEDIVKKEEAKDVEPKRVIIIEI